MKTLNLISVSVIFFLAACSSVGPRVIDKADNESAPDWVSTINPYFERDGKMYFVGYVEVDGNASKSAALNMSDEKTMAEPFRALAEEFMDQNQVGEELRKEASVGQRIISATRGYRPAMPSLRVVNRYWEVIAIGGEHASLNLRAYSLVEIPIADYETAKATYLSKLAGNSEVRRILQDVGAKQRDRILSRSDE